MSRKFKGAVQDFTEDIVPVILVSIMALVLGVLILLLWAALLGGLAWGIWTVATQGPSLWPIVVIVVTAFILIVDIGRRVMNR